MKTGGWMAITEENCGQELFEYADRKGYARVFQQVAGECPYDTEDLSQEHGSKERMAWFFMQWLNPQTGKTILEEFVENTEMDAGLKAKMLQMRQLRLGEFKVVSVEGKIMKVTDAASGGLMTIELIDLSHAKRYAPGREVVSLFHPWGEVYRFNGIARIKESNDEALARLGLISPKQMMNYYTDQSINDAESIILYRHSTVSSIVNKYPFQWVDGMCKALGVRERFKDDKAKSIASVLKTGKVTEILGGLPKESGDALAFVLERGGIVKYSQLSDKFGDEDSFFWNERPPKSAAGLLRLHGFLYVGKMALDNSGRLYRVALVPQELRELLSAACREWDLE
ncbi:MAG: hypothetical protein V1708_06225 [Candidatus Micrarchaeota archaeon]